jgi:hypothetical protein
MVKNKAEMMDVGSVCRRVVRKAAVRAVWKAAWRAAERAAWWDLL